ncbi:MAG TPA: RHS repeat-associated core domain-containing protein [Actinocrinis sp.]|nr:RHS repeat-associated core domain-containing protein [Actinocrinis sp.]
MSVETVSSAKKYNAATATVSTTHAGDLLLAFVGSDSPTSGGQSSTVSGGALTWTLVAADNRQLGDAEVWTAKATGTLTNAKITAKQTVASWDEALTVVAFTGATGVGGSQTADAPTGAPTGTLTTSQPNSWVWAAGDDWLKSIKRTPGPDQTIVHTATDKVGDTYWVQSTSAATPAAGTAVTINDTAPTADPYNLVLVEVLGTKVTAPSVTGVVPGSGPSSGTNAVTVDGANLSGAAEVDFGAVKVTSGIVVAPDGSSLTVPAPPGGVGTVDVRVTTPAGQSAVSSADQYTYTAPAPTAYSGAHLALSPGTAGPNPPHTKQTLKATLTDHAGQPLPGMQVAFNVTGANQTSSSAATDAQGVASFTYTDASAGTDSAKATFAAGPDTVTSPASTITWAAPTAAVAPVSMDPLAGQFFAEPANASVFTATPADTATFAQGFPDLAFNPQPGVIAGDHYPPSPATHPLTDVTTDVAGDANGILPAQGNGQQAGVGALSSFDAVFTTTLHVSQPGDLSYAVDSADGFLLGIGNGASRVNGDYINPPASQQSAFNGYPLVAASNQLSGGTVISHPVTIHFPAAGAYPLELDYFSRGGPQLSLVLRPSAAAPSTPNTPPVNVYVGYQDTLRSSNDYTISPLPWYGSPNVTFEGDSSAQGPGADAGGVRFDNVTNAPVTLDKVTVDVPVPGGGAPVHYDQWPAGMVVAPGQTLIITENAGFASFDTSDDDPGACGVIQSLVPLINVTIGGVTSVYKDSGEVLNTGGFDLACLGNESEPWVRVGTSGPANPLTPTPRTSPAAGWDQATKSFVLFGGNNTPQGGLFLGDTWVWQKGRWTQISPASAPPARAYAASAYDSATGTFVIFGGYNLQTGTNYNDTWTFDGKNWTQQHPAHSPPALNQASDKMAYDDATGTLVLVTSDALGSQNPDTWTWDGTDWTEHAAATQPTARWQPALAYNPDADGLMLFGGSTGYNGPELADTWFWDGVAWTQLSPLHAPPARAAATMDYVPAAHGLVLFSGDQGTDDTWAYTSGDWTQSHPASSPPPRGYAVSAYDPVDQAQIVAFGGQNGSLSQPLGDLWFLDNGSWSNTLPSAAGPVLAPATSLAISPGLNQSYPAGLPRAFTISAVDYTGQPLAGLTVQVQITGANPGTTTVTTDGNGTAAFTDPGTASGIDQIQAGAAVAGTQLASNLVNVTWAAPASGPAPAIGASSPADGTVVRAPVPVTANLTPPPGQSIASWTVTAQSSAPGSPPFTLASGNGSAPGTLATFDPTSLANGQYDLTISATASGGGVQTQTSALSVAGPMKLGAYQATYHELTVPVDGLSMTVDRVYDSTDHSTGDFGAGWHVDLSNIQVATGRALGSGGWQQYVTSCGFLSCDYGYKAVNVTHSATVTWPDGHQEVFDLTPTGSEFGGLLLISPSYTPRPGTNTVDTLSSDGSLAFGDDGNLYNSTVAQVSDGTVYNPTRFTLTTRDGTVYTLDTARGLVAETDSAGVSLTVDGAGVHGSNGQSITFTRDAAHGNRITKIAGPDDGVNGQDQHWTYAYNSAGRLAAVTDPVTSVNYAYDPSSGQLLKSTDANNQPITTITYGSDGRVTSVAQGSNPPVIVASDSAARSQTLHDPNGKLTTTELYDTSGDLVEQDQSSGATTSKTTYTYDSSGRRTSTTDPTGATVADSYDESPGPSNGQVLIHKDADGRTTTYAAYNQFGRPGEMVNPDGTVARVVTYNPTTGQALSSDVPGLAATTYTYNSDGTLASTTDPAGRRTNLTYDSNGNLATQTDGASHTIHTVEDSNGRALSQTDASGHETDYTYDANGNLTVIKTAVTGATETATYNGYNSPLTVTDQDGKATSYAYDTTGKVIKRTSPDGVVTTYSYDADGNMTSETSPSGVTHYTYDALEQLVEADNANAETDLGYDAAGRLLTQTTCASAPSQTSCPAGSTTIKHAVDPAGLITSSDTPVGHTAYGYDGDGRLSTVTDPSGGVFAYSYDGAGRVTGLARPNGALDSTSYNDADQATALTTTNRGGATLAKAANTFDPATGLITAMSDLAGSNTYTYNPDGTLAAATHPAGTTLPSESYTYDAAGNRLTGTTSGAASTYDPANRLLSDGANTYTWNGEGDLATKTNTATHVTTTYAWDADNHLISTSPSSGGGATEKYDAFGRLVSETSGTQVTTNLWDGETLVQQATATSGGTSATNVVANPASGDPTAPPATTLETVTGPSVLYPIDNLHGDQTGTTTPQGALNGALTDYSAFGVPNAPAAPGSLATFDGYHASATGLDVATARAYDPATGRFLSPDVKPALNKYSYTVNDPINRVDPTGAEEFVEYAATFYPSLKTVNKCLNKAGKQSPAASFICLAGGDPKATLNLNSGTITISMGNPGFLATGYALKTINQAVQQAIPPEQLKADAQAGPLAASVVGFVELFFGYDDPSD